MRSRMADIVEALRRVPLFQGLDDTAAESLVKLSRIRVLRRREALFHEDDPGSSLYVVLSGLLGVTTLNSDGASTTIGERGPGDHVGDLSLLDGRRRGATVTVLEDAELLILDREDFYSAIEKNPAIARKVIIALTSMLRDATEKGARDRHADVLSRVCATLIEVAQNPLEDERPPMIRMKQHEIAERIGSSRESVNRSLAKLQRMGAIAMQGRTIVIRRDAALRKRAGID